MLALWNSLRAGGAVCDGTGRVLMADDAYLDLLKWDRDKLGAISREVVTHPADRERNLLLLDRQKEDGQPFEITKRYVRPDGEAIWVQNCVSLLHGDEGARALVISRPLPSDGAPGAPNQLGRMHFAGMISETVYGLGLQAERFGLPGTAALLESAADAAIPEARG